MSVDDPDDLGHTVPQKPSELAALSDDELFALVRKIAFANMWQVSEKAEFEATARLIASLKRSERPRSETATSSPLLPSFL